MKRVWRWTRIVCLAKVRLYSKFLWRVRQGVVILLACEWIRGVDDYPQKRGFMFEATFFLLDFEVIFDLRIGTVHEGMPWFGQRGF